MPEQSIKITIDENGDITAKTEGFKGAACLSELELLLQNETPEIIKKTDEYYQEVKTSNIEKVRSRRS